MSELSAGLRLAWRSAQDEARRGGAEFIEPVHLFVGVCKVPNALDISDWSGISRSDQDQLRAEAKRIAEVFRLADVEPKNLYRNLRRLTAGGNVRHDPDKPISRSTESRAAFVAGAKFAGGRSSLESRDLLVGLLISKPESLRGLLAKLDVDLARLTEVALAGTENARSADSAAILPRLGRDLSELARTGAIRECIGRRKELLQLVRTLSRVTKNNPVLIGDPGVGKTAIVEGLAWRIANGKSLQGKRIIELSVGDLVAGASYRGEFEERLQALVREVAKRPDVILFIDEIHTLVRAGVVEHGALDAANILKPALARGALRLIGATTSAEFEEYFAKDAAFERRFQPIMVAEPTVEEAAAIVLAGYVVRFESEYGVHIEDGVPELAAKLAHECLPSRRLPDKAIDLLDEACARVVFPALTAGPGDAPVVRASVTKKIVAEVVSVWTGIPIAELILTT